MAVTLMALMLGTLVLIRIMIILLVHVHRRSFLIRSLKMFLSPEEKESTTLLLIYPAESVLLRRLSNFFHIRSFKFLSLLTALVLTFFSSALSSSANVDHMLVSGSVDGNQFSGQFVDISYNYQSYEQIVSNSGYNGVKFKYTYIVDLNFNLLAPNTISGFYDLDFEMLFQNSNVINYNVEVLPIDGLMSSIYGKNNFDTSGHAHFHVLTTLDSVRFERNNVFPVASLKLEFYTDSANSVVTAFGGTGSFNLRSVGNLSNSIVDYLNQINSSIASGNATATEIFSALTLSNQYLTYINNNIASLDQHNSDLLNSINSVVSLIKNFTQNAANYLSQISDTQLPAIQSTLDSIYQFLLNSGDSAGSSISGSSHDLNQIDQDQDQKQEQALNSANVSLDQISDLNSNVTGVFSTFASGVTFWERIIQGFASNAVALWSVFVVGLIIGLMNFILRR